MRVALYARVSDDKKKIDGDRRQDIHRQLTLLEEHAKKAGHQELNIYQDDGKSAYTDDINQRPEFKRLLNDCRRYFVNQIFIEDMTRFSRNLSSGLQWLKELGSIGCTVTSLKEGELEVTSSRGWMQSTMLLFFAEWDSRVKSEKVKSGMQRAKNKNKHIGRPPKERVGEKADTNSLTNAQTVEG